MEAITSTSAPLQLRPQASSLSSEISAVLRNGRIVAAEVLRVGADGTVLLAIGRQRVPAESQVALDPGERFLLRAEQSSAGVVLRILGTDAPDGSDLLRALRRVVGQDQPLGELFSKLAHEVRSRATEREGSTLLGALTRHGFAAEGGSARLLALLARSAIRYEAALAAALRGPMTEAVLERLRSNLKGELLRALERHSAGPLRESIERALGAIEAEQLLNLARDRAGEPYVWSLPVPDLDGWTTARFLFRARREGDEQKEGEAAAPDRLVLGVRFSRLGPIRIELTLDRDVILARILVARPELLERLRTDFEDLSQRMGGGRRKVHLFLRVVDEREVDLESERLDIRFLEEERLMDVLG